MKYVMHLLLGILCLAGFSSTAQITATVKSPNGKLVYSIKLLPEHPVYSIVRDSEKLITESPLGLRFIGDDVFAKNLQIGKLRRKSITENYTLVTGKASHIRSLCNELVVPLIESDGAKRTVHLVVRAFDDGIAFRYEFPKQAHWENYILTDENSTFNISGNPKIKTLLFKNYNNSHEGLYQNFRYKDAKENVLMDLPTLFQFENCYMAITEANLHDYAGMYLIKQQGVLKSQLSPLQGQEAIKVKAALPHSTPWRVMMISENPGGLIASNILTSLNEPSKIKDWSWLKPGKTTFHWWNGDVLPAGYKAEEDFESNKYYIDFAAKNNIEYHSVIGYNKKTWYKSDWPDYNTPGTYADLTQTVSTLDMQKLCAYAKSKGVGIHVWVNWKALYPQLDAAFDQFQKWGIKGMMVDFLDRDDQEMVNIQEEILQKAAAHQLFIQFHGAYKATGMNRTYPNELTREGTYNYEQNKWSKAPVSPEQDLDIVFTRMLGGASDYHLGGFRAVAPDKFKPQFIRPLMAGTRCHMLAMYVVMESYLHMVADDPEAYKDQPGFEFLQQVPTNWDETRVLSAAIDNYVCIARRKGNDWFIGTINNSRERTINITLDFIKNKNYRATIYSDAAGVSENPNILEKTNQPVKAKDKIDIRMAAGGGSVIQLREE